MSFHVEIPLPPLLGLVHVQIPLAFAILGGLFEIGKAQLLTHRHSSVQWDGRF